MAKKFKFGFALAICTLMLLASGPICEMIGVDFGGVVDIIEVGAVSGSYQDNQGVYYKYSTVSGKNIAKVVCFYEYTSSVVIPSSIKVNDKIYSVTSIDDYAFEFCNDLTSITIPNSVTSIGESAFYYCDSLTKITVPTSVISVGEDAFYGTKWYKNQAYGMVYLGNIALEYKGEMPENTSISIKSGTVAIADCAFYYDDELASITIPYSVNNIGHYAFRYCYNLKNINVSAYNKHYIDVDGVLFNKNKTTLIQYPVGKTESSYTIPNSVTRIEDEAFYYCSNLTNITIPNSVKSIGKLALYNTGWYYNKADGVVYAANVALDYKGEMPKNTSIKLKAGTVGIADYAFGYCDNLTSIIIPDSVMNIGYAAFYDCDNLTSVIIPDSVISIGDYAFYWCGLTKITIPDSVTSIGYCAFKNCLYLKTVTYKGIKKQWDKIKIGDYNDEFTSAEIDYSPSINLVTPKIITASKNASAVKLYWNKVPMATGYRVYMKVNNTWKALTNIFDENAKSYYIGNLLPNTSYQFCIRAFVEISPGKYYFSSPTSEYTVKTEMKTELKETKIGYGSVKLNWTKTPNASGYVVKQKVNGIWKAIKYVSSAYDYSYITNLKQGTKYYFYVTAYVKSDSGKISYLAGDFDIVTTLSTQVKINTTYASAKSAVKIYWNKVSVASGYRVYCYYNGKCISAQNVTTNSYYKGGLKISSKYQFVVKAYKVNPNKTITYYANSSIKTTMTSLTQGKITAAATNATAVKIAWAKVPNATGYRVYMKVNGKWAIVKNIFDANASSYYIGGLKSKTTYEFRVTPFSTATSQVVWGGVSYSKFATTKALNSIIIGGVDIGYESGDFFTKNGKACTGHKISGLNHFVNTDPRCNCLRYVTIRGKRVDLLSTQCFGFVRYCEYMVYGVHDGSAPSKFIDITGKIPSSACTPSRIKAEYLNCAPATHVRTGDNGHSIAIVSTSATGLVVAEGNYSSNCDIRLTTLTWEDFARKLSNRAGIFYSKSYIGK